MIVSRPIPYIIVINPPGFTARWRKFNALLEPCKTQLPPVIRMGVNKNHLNFSTGDYPSLKDIRTWRAKLKLKLGREPNAIDFTQNYAKYFRTSASTKPKSARPGVIACAISHIQAWGHIEKTLNDEQVALVMEDDYFPNLKLPLAELRMPAEADILHFPRSRRSWTGEHYDSEFWHFSDGWGAHMYAITRQGVRKVHETILPLPLGKHFDEVMFGGATLRQNKYKVFALPDSTERKNMLQISYDSTITTHSPIHNLVIRIYQILSKSELFRKTYRRFIKKRR